MAEENDFTYINKGFIKEEISDKILPEGIKHEEVLKISYGGLIHIKEEEELLVPDVDPSGIDLKEGLDHELKFNKKFEQKRKSNILMMLEDQVKNSELEGTQGLEISPCDKDLNDPIHSMANDTSKKIYCKCRDCGCYNRIFVGSKYHDFSHHQDEVSYQCPQCHSKPVTSLDLKRNVVCKDLGEKVQSPHCDKVANNGSLKSHISSNHTGKKKPRQCLQCDFKSATTRGLTRHITVRHTGEKPHQCPHCDYRSVIAKSLKTHIMAHHTGEKPYQCPHCDYKSVKAQYIKKHIMVHHAGEKPYQCPYCDYKATYNNCLKRHLMVLHTGERPHQCPQCDYKTVASTDLKMHVMVHHTGEKPHQCPHCDYKSVTALSLKKHIMAQHTRDKPYQCPHCKYNSVDSKVLKIHIMTHHTGKKPYQCPYCEYKAVQSSSLKRHMIVHHKGEKPHQFPKCDYKSVTSSEMKRHLMARHTDEKPC